MVDVITANNTLVNSLIFPGHLTRSTINGTYVSYQKWREILCRGAEGLAVGEGGGGGMSPNLKLLFITWKRRYLSAADCFNLPGAYIPSVPATSESTHTWLFVIHFHGNACNSGQVGICSIREGYAFNAHGGLWSA